MKSPESVQYYKDLYVFIVLLDGYSIKHIALTFPFFIYLRLYKFCSIKDWYIALMIVVDTRGEVNPKETKAQLTTTAGVLDMQGFN